MILSPLVVFLILWNLADSQSICTHGYSLLNDHTCVKVVTDGASYLEAILNCRSFPGGDLVSIHNAIDNRALVNLATAARITLPVWLGLECSTTRDPSSCVWNDQSGTAASYSNFLSGYPQTANGTTNVYLLTSGDRAGQWGSVRADGSSYSYMCAYPASTTPLNTCEFSWGDYCYTPYFLQVNQSAASAICSENCGDLVSIHSEQENAFILSLYKNSQVAYTRIGGIVTDFREKYWTDRTPWDYDNTGFLGGNACMSMAVKDDIVSAGQWITSDCDRTNLDFVCKRAKSVTCEPTASPTLAPSQCNGTIYGDSHTYSPNYPYSYIGAKTPCIYVFGSPQRSISQIMFSEFVLDSKSSISIYAQIEDTVPMAVLTSTTRPIGYYNATGNELKMVFRPCLADCDSGDFRWRAFHTYK